MISAKDFKAQWEAEEEFELVVAKADCPRLTSLPAELQKFLLEAGLPDAAAPFLSFDVIERHGLTEISEVWGSPDDYSESEKERLSRYFIIGSDGSGNPLAIDTDSNFEIVHLDHDNWFQTVTILNSSLFHLAEFLLLVRDMVSKAHNELSETELEEEIPARYKGELFTRMKFADKKAWRSGGYWETEVDML
ncbi:SMI1/KNR4 family protein [Exilibacterium tricleocarpae]|uniref:SMI1/KNR4 family protein n=1 Tax=Exilibacterium tricleocarpae TaxID=2591008 RepID=A0A545SLG9_9GAMM|nr:SUKH-4 family immunity protein [Exilibacterium tricleocarpae]TQV65818.1 SMI1/KNR4 family protein [Exilibacterium tricleocarpae]